VATMCLLSMMLLFWCILGFSPASWLLGAEIATGLMVFRRLHRCHTIRCVRLLLTCPGPMALPMDILVCAGCRYLAERLLRSGAWLADDNSPRAMTGSWITME
jgi:hypothetical protein